MSYLTVYFCENCVDLRKITEKMKFNLRNVVTNGILYSKITFRIKLSLVNVVLDVSIMQQKGAGNYAFYHVRKKY